MFFIQGFKNAGGSVYPSFDKYYIFIKSEDFVIRPLTSTLSLY